MRYQVCWEDICILYIKYWKRLVTQPNVQTTLTGNYVLADHFSPCWSKQCELLRGEQDELKLSQTKEQKKVGVPTAWVDERDFLNHWALGQCRVQSTCLLWFVKSLFFKKYLIYEIAHLILGQIERNLSITESQVQHSGLCINFIKKKKKWKTFLSLEFRFFLLLLGPAVIYGFQRGGKCHTYFIGRNLKFPPC